jgi:hypothetical protein
MVYEIFVSKLAAKRIDNDKVVFRDFRDLSWMLEVLMDGLEPSHDCSLMRRYFGPHYEAQS